MDLAALSAHFPRSAVHWRAQTLTRAGDKALALAYLDARDVMDRLDEVCGPAKWQTRHTETPKGRVLCEIGIFISDRWVWKSDGAGDTAVEGEKGGISDAFKRAAVHWGIGRYLYRLDAVWAPCETYERGGKLHWKAWRGSPWDSVRNAQLPPQPEGPSQTAIDCAISDLSIAQSAEELRAAFLDMPGPIKMVPAVIDAGKRRKAALENPAPQPDPISADKIPY
jgi:hypothetical protein